MVFIVDIRVFLVARKSTGFLSLSSKTSLVVLVVSFTCFAGTVSPIPICLRFESASLVFGAL